MSRLLRRRPPGRGVSLADAGPVGPWWAGLARDARYAWRAIGQRALRVTTASSLVGAVLAFGLGRLMQSLLPGLMLTNLWQLATLVLVLSTAALLAAYLPARRAARIDPMNALRDSV